MEWLTYINSELHKAFSPLFNPATSDDAKEAYRAALAKKFDFVSQSLGERAYLLGDAFSVADAYLFTVLRWCHYVGVNLEQWPVLKAFSERVAHRPMVHAALVAEGLIKTAPQH
jgi:glutathione S-transferase